jgi:hypothetical protein
MPRFSAVAVATLLLALPTPAAAQTPGDVPPTVSCVDAAGGSTATAAVSDGGTLGPSTTPVPDAGGGVDPSLPSGADTSTAAEGGASSTGESGGSTRGARASARGVPLASAAQDPEPEPEGPGEQQPTQPGGEPQPPAGEDDEGGGGLPQTGLEALQLGLLGLVLLMVGARVRAIAKQRRRPAADAGREDEAELAPDGLPRSPSVVAYRDAPEEAEALAGDAEELELGDAPARDEWSFPDPNEPAPTGLLPSTAIARRQARRRADASEPD